MSFFLVLTKSPFLPPTENELMMKAVNHTVYLRYGVVRERVNKFLIWTAFVQPPQKKNFWRGSWVANSYIHVNWVCVSATLARNLLHMALIGNFDRLPDTSELKRRKTSGKRRLLATRPSTSSATEKKSVVLVHSEDEKKTNNVHHRVV
jgi:hypothetical protein